MTSWGYLLLIGFVVIGLRSTAEHKAITTALGLTVAAMVYAFYSYSGL